MKKETDMSHEIHTKTERWPWLSDFLEMVEESKWRMTLGFVVGFIMGYFVFH